MKVQSSALAILAVSAGTAPSFIAKLSCPWKVTSDDIVVNKPVIRQSNPGRDCNYANNAALHMKICEQCGNSHVPCNNTFTACAGCCQSQNDIALREHDCEEVKDYFRWRNECPLKLMEANITDEPDTSAILQPVIKDHSAATVLAQGTKTTTCQVGVEQFDCPKVPAIVEFDCMQCNIGSADLMAKCCNECVRFSTSETLANVSQIEPFVVCKGCQTKTINVPWKGTVTQQPWIHAGKYDDYSRKSQEDRMDKWVDTKICSKLAKDTCKDPPRKSGRLLREAASTTSTTTRVNLAEHCRRLQEFKNSTVATTVAGAVTIAGASTTAVGDAVKLGNAAPSPSTPSPSVADHSSGSGPAAMPATVLMAAIVASVVLV